jgi:hypothetical protein
MKFILVLLMMSSCLIAKSQETFALLTDSLTNKLSRTWLQCNDTSLKQSAASCFRGKEYSFYKKDKKGVKRKCINGKWVETTFSWVIEKENDNYVVRIKNKEGQHDNIRIQLIKEAGIIKTRLTQIDYDRKEVDRFCIQLSI